MLQPQSHYDLSFFLLNVPLISAQMHIQFDHFFFFFFLASRSIVMQRPKRRISPGNKSLSLSPACLGLSQSAMLTNAGGIFFFFFIAGLCSRGHSVSVIRIWGLSWLTYVLSLLVQPFPPLKHITAQTQGERERAAEILPDKTSRPGNKCFCKSFHLILHKIHILIQDWCLIYNVASPTHSGSL